MTIRFFASHLLQWRVLIPVICQLAQHGHTILVQTTRPNFLGMPDHAMQHTPTNVHGINQTSLTWLADHLSYRNAWAAAQPSIRYCLFRVRADVTVSTTKDLPTLAAMTGKRIAIGYQHFPACVDVGHRPAIAEMPSPFCGTHPFAVTHGFADLCQYGRIVRCPFPHLDFCALVRTDAHSHRALFLYPGSHRGVNDDMADSWICLLAVEAGEPFPMLSVHPIPGRYTMQTLRVKYPHADIYPHWFPAIEATDRVYTFGSSTIYELWSVGHNTVWILSHGVRAEKFALFTDRIVTDENIRYYRDMQEGPVTREVREAFWGVHHDLGTPRAVAMIEGDL